MDAPHILWIVLIASVLCQDLNCTLAHKEKVDLVESKKMRGIHQETDAFKEASSSKDEMVVLVF